MKDFKVYKEKHEEVVNKLGWSSRVEFSRLVESGDIKKAKNFVKNLSDKDPAKKDLTILVNFI